MNPFGKGSGYRWMDAYLLAWIVELATDDFCGRFLDYKSDPQGKTSAQMNHAARSGCRNFAEGCERLMTSASSGMDLLNVAKGSLGELRDDYLKWLLRARQLPWDPAESDALRVQRMRLDPPPAGGRAASTDRTDSTDSAGTVGTVGTAGTVGTGRGGGAGPFTNRRFCEHLLAQYVRFAPWLESPDSFVRANALVILCTRACKLQEAYIRRLGDEFKAEGGFRERLGEARREERAHQEGGAPTGAEPRCPLCGTAMRLMHRKRDNNPFWGCGGYPGCRGTLPCEASGRGSPSVPTAPTVPTVPPVPTVPITSPPTPERRPA